MTFWLLLLGALTFLAALVAAWGAFRKTTPADQLSQEHLERRLDRSEGRVLEQINRLREGVSSGLRESTEAAGKAQRELAVELRRGLDEMRTEVLKSIVERFEGMRTDLGEVLAAARKSQDERLDKVEAAFTAFTTTFQKATAELRTSLLEAAKAQDEKQVRAAGELRTTVAKSLGDTHAALGEQFRVAQKDLAETLRASRESQEERLGKVEASLGQFGKDFKQEVGELKASLVRETKSQSETLSKSLSDLSDRLAAGQAEARKELTTALEAQKTSLDQARQAQEERLGKVEASVVQFGKDFKQEIGELKATLIREAKAQSEALTKSLSDLSERLVGAQTEARKEQATALQAQKTSLDQARQAQEDRLSKVEVSLVQFGKDFKQEVGDLKAASARETKTQSEALTKSLSDLSERLVGAQTEARKEQATALLAQKASLDQAREAHTKSLGDMQGALTADFGKLRDAQAKAFSELQDRVQSRLDEVRKDNEEKLEKIRTTVEEKLQSTLEARLGESFRLVSDRLEQVYKGLGEMRTLATGVGDLKRVLTNVRSRGTFGEVQLSALLEQVLTPEQYGTNVVTVPGSSERVEFAIKLPGRDDGGGTLFLPIDAKFPLEDYQRLQQAYEDGDVGAVEDAKKALRHRALLEAKTIHEKYLAPPHTTDFALLFLPTEGLYAEVLRIPGLFEEIQRVHRVVPVGPTNIQAFLNSLQMGFRTLAIEKRSSEVWKVLGAVKTEFARFGESLDAVGKKLQEASNKIEATSQRSRAMQRKLREVESLPADEAARILPIPEMGAVDDDAGPAE